MDGYSPELRAFLLAVSGIELIVCIAVVAVLARRWHRQRSAVTASVLSVYVVFALVLAMGFFTPEQPRGWGAFFVDVQICLLLLIPFLLAEFTWLLGGTGLWTHRLVVGLLVVQVLATLATPPLPEPGQPRPAWAQAFVALVVLAWNVQAFIAARGLWKLSRGQSSVVRNRLRTLSAGAILLALTLVVSGATGGTAASWVTVTISVLGLLSVLLYVLAFVAPWFLRVLWRQGDLAALSRAERGLMQALTRHDVAETIVPVLADAFGGSGAALLDGAGSVVRLSGSVDAEQIAAAHAAEAGDEQVSEPVLGVLTARLSSGWLVVTSGILAPAVGNDEAELLGRVATLVDLALQRVDLFEQERASREAAEAANEELETLLYSVSHDLRSPLISVLGYLDFLKQEYGDALTGEAPHYLERISVNAMYMQSLIADLLELSRIGRIEPDPQVVDLSGVAEEVCEGARLRAPQAHLEVVGDLPLITVSDVRVRQLLTNLVDNALKHGGRPTIRVTISLEPGQDGCFVLRVADDGRGVPVEYRARVLRVFERLNAPKSSTGTGIGLAICKRIAESLGGSVAVGGPADGDTTGTTVDISLPVHLLVSRTLPEPRDAATAAPKPAVEVAL
ncbi:MAG: HAMP domain-containing sensor histidine kinase [Mycobacteriales bacterium]|nr:HAMP domain-containing sensor histidine kinase [Mycobacteriales bacterium]